MPKQVKIDAVAGLKERIGKTSALYFVDFTKLAANDFNTLRRKLGESKVAVRVVKNRLALRALTESGVPADIEKLLTGPTSLVFAVDDPIAPARTIREQMKKMAALKVKGAYLDRVLYPADQFNFIAGLPTKNELRGEVVGVLQGPIYGLVTTLDGLLSEFVWVLDQVKDRPRATAPAADAPAPEATAPAPEQPAAA
ncbi:50S ribosomal protein L10 [candidate division WOR-3 bacterium]|uniref:Large ribosomal subunit protein uL10 n=1 Tax=candidate division WOR-3 bacterium TaxID=2052148 RepID=A0A937XEU0_UNCW3|nr:50S ribosomal protein L10 [candidate division WOR-3 bacterium]